MGNGTFPWTTAELESELNDMREAWHVAKFLGESTTAIERAGHRLANELAACKAQGGTILL